MQKKRNVSVTDDDKKNAQKIRNGLFLAPSRTYGEQYLEPVIRHIYGLTKPTGQEHDAEDSEGMRFEIKACKVLKPTKKSESLLEQVLYENTNSVISRLVNREEVTKVRNLANVQNVKRDHFEHLLYCLLFADMMQVFSITRDEVKDIPSWSDKHGRYDQLGKSGQFPITKSNYDWHAESRLVANMDYSEIAAALREISNK